MPTREQCLREAGTALLNAAIRIEQNRIDALAKVHITEASRRISQTEARRAAA